MARSSIAWGTIRGGRARVRGALTALLALSLAGCVIGPKPDDPALGTSLDAGFVDAGYGGGASGDDAGLAAPSDATSGADTGKSDNGGGVPGTGCGDAGDASPDADAAGCEDAGANDAADAPEAGDALDDGASADAPGATTSDAISDASSAG